MDPVQFLSCVQHINYHLLVNMKYSVIQRVFIVETYIRMKSHREMLLQILELDSWCFSFITINILSTVNKFQATVSFF